MRFGSIALLSCKFMQVLRFRGTMGALWFWRKRSIWELCIFGQGAEFEKGPRQNGYVNFCFIGAFLSLRFWSATLFFGEPFNSVASLCANSWFECGVQVPGLMAHAIQQPSQLTTHNLRLTPSITYKPLGKTLGTRDANPAPKSLQSMPQHDLHRSMKDGNGTEYERNRNGLPRSPRHFVCAFVHLCPSVEASLLSVHHYSYFLSTLPFHPIVYPFSLLFCDHTRPSSSPGKSPSVDLAFATSQTM